MWQSDEIKKKDLTLKGWRRQLPGRRQLTVFDVGVGRTSTFEGRFRSCPDPFLTDFRKISSNKTRSFLTLSKLFCLFPLFCSNSEVQKFDSTSVCSECFYFFFSLPGRDFNQKSATTTLTTMLTTMTTAVTSTTMKSEQEDKSSSLWARNELEIFFSLSSLIRWFF